MQWVSPVSPGYERVNASFVKGMDTLVVFHRVNVILGAICTVLAAINVFIFLGSSKFRNMFKILTALAVADLINTIAMMVMGLNRLMLYSSVLNTLVIPIRNSWDCAIEPWIWLKGIGDLWPPVIHMIMGFERATAIMYPMFFREKIEKGAKRLIASSVIFVIGSLIIGFTLAFVKASNGPVMYYCGRKAAFTTGYGIFIYATNIIGYFVGFIFNLCAYIKAYMLQKSFLRSTHLKKIRYYLIISFLSTVLVSVPNFISIFSAWFGSINNAISRPSVYMACINSALSLFVYFVLNSEYRERCLILMRCREPASPPGSYHLGPQNSYKGPVSMVRSTLNTSTLA